MSAPVINLTTSVLGYGQWEPWVYQPAASIGTSDPAITGWSAVGLPPGMSQNTSAAPITVNGVVYGPGAIYGAATQAGVFLVNLGCTNGSWATPVILTIGIEPRANAAHSGVDLFVNAATGEVTTSLTASTSSSDYLYAVREGDALIHHIQFHRDGTVLDLPIKTLEVAFKEFEPDNVLLLGGGTDGTESSPTGVPKFVRNGSGTNAVYLLCTEFLKSELQATLSNYEADSGTHFVGLAQIEWSEDNTAVSPNPQIGPVALRRTSLCYNIRVDREIVPI